MSCRCGRRSKGSKGLPLDLMPYPTGYERIRRKFSRTSPWLSSCGTYRSRLTHGLSLGRGLNPLPKIDVPKENGDYRGINVTPVMARVFQMVVYRSHAKEPFDNSLAP